MPDETWPTTKCPGCSRARVKLRHGAAAVEIGGPRTPSLRVSESVPHEQMTEIVNAYMAYTKALQDAKVLVGSNRLRPTSAAITVRTVDGQTKVLDGPFAESKEQVGGYYLIDVPDLDAALDWAKRCPGARYGTVEVRPIWVM